MPGAPEADAAGGIDKLSPGKQTFILKHTQEAQKRALELTELNEKIKLTKSQAAVATATEPARIAEAAQQLGVARVSLSRVINGRAAISPEMALRLEAWLGKERGGHADAWIAGQCAYDMWQAEQKLKKFPLRVQPAPAELIAA